MIFQRKRNLFFGITGLTHGDRLEYAGTSLNVYGTIIRDTDSVTRYFSNSCGSCILTFAMMH